VTYTGNNDYVANDLVIPGVVYDIDGTEYTITTIGEQTFYNCSGLTGSLTIRDGVTIIMAEAFHLCDGLIGNLIIPNSVEGIGG
jgi:hypothetical protein